MLQIANIEFKQNLVTKSLYSSYSSSETWLEIHKYAN